VNTDGTGRGFLDVEGSHTLQKFVNQVERDVIDPEYKIPVADRKRAQGIADAAPADLEELWGKGDLAIGALGSGSDYTPFLQHLGVAALNLGFGGEDGGGSYHSAYDSFDYYANMVIPTFPITLPSRRQQAGSFSGAGMPKFSLLNFPSLQRQSNAMSRTS